MRASNHTSSSRLSLCSRSSLPETLIFPADLVSLVLDPFPDERLSRPRATLERTRTRPRSSTSQPQLGSVLEGGRWRFPRLSQAVSAPAHMFTVHLSSLEPLQGSEARTDSTRLGFLLRSLRVTGGDLFSYVSKHQGLEQSETKYLLYQLLKGVKVSCLRSSLCIRRVSNSHRPFPFLAVHARVWVCSSRWVSSAQNPFLSSWS